MYFPITHEQEMIRMMVEQFAQKEVAPGAGKRDREAAFPKELIGKMAGLGLLGMMVPAEYGGAEVGAVAYVLAMMEIAAACASTAVTMSVTNLACEPLLRFGTEEQKRRLLTPLASGKVLGAFALTEPGAGSNLAEVSCKARKKGARYFLDGRKVFITNGGHAGVIMVLARTGDGGGRGLTAFCVEAGAAGLTIGPETHKMGLRASSTVELIFEDCEVPEDNRIGREGDGIRVVTEALFSGRIGIAAQATGMMKSCLDLAVSYANERRQFNKPLAGHQAIQWMIAEIATDLEAARLLTLSAAALKEQGAPFAREASMAKFFASEALNRAAYKALQVHGGYGYTTEYEIERIYRDARVTTIYEGTSEVQRMVIARETLRQP
ncbi:MAG TPA: acyl-CoA dehydrogenase family protein [bacterium]|nr:acyl-CoA dehydrogenase family protein [bacterium]